MKIVINVLISIILFFLNFTIESQELYYYIDNNKVYLFEDKKSIVLVFNEDAYYKNRAERFENDTTIIEMDVSCGDEDLYFARLTFSEILKYYK